MFRKIVSLVLIAALCLSFAVPVLATEGLFSIAGSNMTLGNELVLNFMINVTDIDDLSDYTALVTHGAETTELPLREYNAKYHCVSYGVAAKEMADDVVVQIYDANGNAVSQTYTGSVRSYAAKALASTATTEKVKTMVVDMLNYGAAAQQHFKYNTDDLANNILSEEQKLMATGTVSCINGQIKGDNCYGSNLSLEECILLNMFFSGMKGKEIASMYATVSFTGYDDVTKNITVYGSEFVRYSADIYRVVVDDIVLADAECPVTVTVYNADGTVHGAATDSVESYNARAAATDTYGLYANIMKFAASAYAYLADKNGLTVHEWNTGELIVAATDTQEGQALYTCLDADCGATKTKTVAAGTKIYTRADLEVAVEEVAWDYLLKKDKIQYDSMELDVMGKYYSGKYRITEDGALENGTSHTEINSVCSDYVWKVYEEAVNHKLLGGRSSLEAVTADMWYCAENQYGTDDDIDSTLVRWQTLAFNDWEIQYGVPDSPHFVDTKEEVYAYFTNWETMLRPGDVLVDKGHAMLYAGNGKVLHCNGTKYDRLTGTINHEDSGAVYGVSPQNCSNLSWLDARAATGRLIIWRPTEFMVTKDTDGDLSNDMVRDPNFTMPKDTVSRLEYPGMEIDRTVNITPFGTASVGQELTYSIKISNMTTNTKYMDAMKVSDPTYTGVNYENLVVTEVVPEGTQFVSATEGGTYDEATNTITWTLNISAGKVVTPAYTVKVTGKIGDTIVSGSGFVADIPSNVICNRIGGEKLNEFAVTALADLAKSTDTWDFGTDLTFAEKIYEAAETKLELPTVAELVDAWFYWTNTLGEGRSPRYGIGNGKTSEDVFMLRENADMSMVIPTYYGGFRFFTGNDAIGSTINEFRLSYLEPGDIIVNCHIESGAVTGSQIMVYAGDDTLLICNADGTYQVLTGNNAYQQLWNSYLKDTELFFALRPSQVADLQAAHTWDEGTITKAPTCSAEGEMVYTCLDDGCGATKTKVLDKTTDHVWNEEGTDNGNGMHTVACGNCGTTKTELHTWDDGEGDSSEMTFTCTTCGATKTEVGGLSDGQIDLLQSFGYKKGNMSAATNIRQAPLHYADTIYAAMCMDGLAELYNSGFSALGALSQAFKQIDDSANYGNYDRAFVLRTEANGYLTNGTTVYNAATMIVDGFYGGPWIVDENGDRLTNRGAQMEISDLQPGDVLVLGENSAKYEAMMWALVYQGEVNGQHCFLFGNSYYGGTYTNVSVNSVGYRGYLKFDAETSLLSATLFNESISGNGTVVELGMENGIGECSFNEFLMNDPVSGMQWEYFYAIRPCKVMGQGTHTWDAGTENEVGTVYTCTNCGTTKLVKAHAWGEGVITKAPTCGAEGEMTYTCLDCGEVKTEVLDATGEHDWGNASDNNDGNTHTVTCGVCETIKTEKHNIVGDTCSDCGASVAVEYALTEAQRQKLLGLTYKSGNMSAATNSRQRPMHYADTIYAAIGLDGLVEKFNGSLTASALLSQFCKMVGGSSTLYGNYDRDYVLRTEANGYLTDSYIAPTMLVDGFYGGPWLVDDSGNRLTDRGAQMSLSDLQPGDVICLGENTGKFEATLWVLVYQGVINGEHTFLYGANYYISGSTGYTNVSGTTVDYRGYLKFNADGVLSGTLFNKSVSGSGSVVSQTTAAKIGTTDFCDILTNDPISGVQWEYFIAIRPGELMN